MQRASASLTALIICHVRARVAGASLGNSLAWPDDSRLSPRNVNKNKPPSFVKHMLHVEHNAWIQSKINRFFEC